MSDYTPRTYRKTATVRAMQWDGTDEGTRALAAWSGGLISPATRTAVPALVVQTLEGPLFMHVGDWALQGDEGEFWPNRGDIFTKSYELTGDTE